VFRIINNILLDAILEKARHSPRKRTSIAFHDPSKDNIQIMLNAMLPKTYLQPHKHEDPDKFETFSILSGRVIIVGFDENGNLEGCFDLDKRSFNKGLIISPRTYHSIVVPENPGYAVVFEHKEGFYDEKTDKKFAPWAPSESQTEEADEYLRQLEVKVELYYVKLKT
jgi:cupin fold WbuC family metalloprotein